MFQNHEIIKIVNPNGFSSSIFIYFVIAAISVCFYGKKNKNSFMNIEDSEQLRGMAILFVLIGHIGIHTLTTKGTWIVLGDYGVSIFFILSGFGLARSYAKKKLVLKEFLLRRLSRVMIPYCLATIIILILDYILIDRVYSLKTIIMTMCGINLSIVAKHIDYVRWYITVLLIWYLFFALYWKLFSEKIRITAFIITGLVLVCFNYYFNILGYAFMSFPCGIIIAVYYDNICKKLEQINHRILLIASISCVLVTYTSSEFLFPQIENIIPYIGIVYFQEFLWVYFTFCISIIIYVIPSYTSPFLKFIGKYSYEIFLFHGVFMIKYDFILYKGPLYFTFWPYFLFIILISVTIKKLIFNKAQHLILK